MISRMARVVLAAAITTTAFTWAPARVTAETTGVGCDLKIGVLNNDPIDDGIQFYNFQPMHLHGSGFPPTSRVELHFITDITPDNASFWEHVRDDGTWTVGTSFGNPELPATDVLITAHAEDDPEGCADSVSGRFLGNMPVFDDIAGSIFWQEILSLHDAGIVAGCRPRLFCPEYPLKRGEMATFLVRALDLPRTEADFFTDDDGFKYEWSINRLAASGVTMGCGDGLFCPTRALRRDEMASFLVRALDLPPTDVDYFIDDEHSTHEADINALREAGITGGCRSADPTFYCPDRGVRRGVMAGFLYRIVN